MAWVVRFAARIGGRPVRLYVNETCSLHHMTRDAGKARVFGSRQAAVLLAQSFNNELTEAELQGCIPRTSRFKVIDAERPTV